MDKGHVRVYKVAREHKGALRSMVYHCLGGYALTYTPNEWTFPPIGGIFAYSEEWSAH